VIRIFLFVVKVCEIYHMFGIQNDKLRLKLFWALFIYSGTRQSRVNVSAVITFAVLKEEKQQSVWVLKQLIWHHDEWMSWKGDSEV